MSETSGDCAEGYRLVILGKPFTTNKHMRATRYVRAAWDTEWRQAGWATARAAGIPSLGAIIVSVQSELKGSRSRDCGSDTSCAKAAVDGLVDARVIPDDTPTYLRGLVFLPPVLSAERDALILNIVEVANPLAILSILVPAL